VTETSSLRGKRVLVLGASGFLGGRLVERLVVECGAEVRILLRRVATGSSAVRFPVEVQMGELADPEAVRRAVAGCSVVFNCAKGSGGDAERRRAVDVDASGEVVEAAARAGARVVHVSSFAVYDLPQDGEVDEHTPATPPGDTYSDNKLAGEQLALATGARLGVPVTVLQPTVIYGPRGTVHGSDILDEMRTGRLVLVNGGTGVCNAVYVDDVVTAMLLAATRDSAAGERILVSGAEHPTWAEFFGHFERMLGRPSTIAMSEAEALALWDASQRRPWLATEALRIFREERAVRRRLLATREAVLVRSVAGRVAPRLVRSGQRWTHGEGAAGTVRETPSSEQYDGAIPSRPWVVTYLAKRAQVRIDKAETLLGYRPAFGLADGMSLTERWVRWANLLA
jgi:nucleoside-diphosphate-sugar epimerase